MIIMTIIMKPIIQYFIQTNTKTILFNILENFSYSRNVFRTHSDIWYGEIVIDLQLLIYFANSSSSGKWSHQFKKSKIFDGNEIFCIVNFLLYGLALEVKYSKNFAFCRQA